MLNLARLPKFKDMRGKLETKGKYAEYPLSEKDTIVIHHSATLSGSAEAYARYHVLTLGWKGIGYHVVIEQDGTIKHCNDLNTKTYHVGNSNKRAIGICLTGDFRKGKQKPTQEQMNALFLVVQALQKDVPSVKHIKRHQDMPGYAWKNCPGDNWDCFAVIKGEGVNLPNVKPEKTEPKEEVEIENLPFEYKIQEGDTFWSIANKHEALTVQELIKLNPSLNAKTLKVGQVIRLAKEAPNTHIVKKGETLWGIARAHNGVTANDILKANPRLKANAIPVGTVLTIPKGEVTEKPKVVVPEPKPRVDLPNRVLREGDNGADVKQVQNALNKLKFNCGNADGDFGKKTLDALRRFQKVHLPYGVDGVYGSKTREAMLKALV